MTNQTIRIPIGQAVAGVVNTDETVSSINLRLSSGGGAVYNGTHIGDGVYEFTNVASGSYKVFSGSSELTKISWVIVGESTAVLVDGSGQVVANLLTFTTGISTNAISERTSGSGVTIDGVLIKDSLDVSGIVAKSGSQTVAGLKSFSNGVATDTIAEVSSSVGVTIDGILLKDDLTTSNIQSLSTSQTVTGAKLHNAGGNITVDGATTTAGYSTNYTVTDNKRWVCLGHMTTYVNAQIQSYIAGNIPAFQQSNTYRQVIYDGSQEDNRIYTSISATVANCVALTPSTTQQFFIQVLQDSNARTSANTISSVEVADYVHIFASNNRLRVFGADDSFDGNSGKTQISNITMVWEAGLTATPNFTGCVFEDVIFDITDNSIDFISCEFRGNCQVLRTTGTWTMNACTGSDITAEVLPTFTGANPFVRVDNQYNYRELGTLPVVASAGTITLTYGNTFDISGTTTITNITTTGWTDGSIITLYFQGSLTFTNNNAGAGHFALAGGVDFSATGGDVITLMLRSSVWYEVSRSVN